MKNQSTLIRLAGAAWACVFALLPAGAAPDASAPTQVDATSQACAGGRYVGMVPQIQKDLDRIYAADAAFVQDAGAGADPLRDGRLGPVTRKWLGVFCARHAFKVREDAFDAGVAAELARFSAGMAPAGPKADAQPALPVEASYRYDPAVLRKPKDFETLMPRLRTLTDRYADKGLFEDAVRRAAKGLALDAGTLARIDDFAAVDGYNLPAAQLVRLQGASAQLLEKLRPRTDVDYAGADQFHQDLQDAVGDGPEKAELVRYSTQIDQLARVTHYRIPPTLETDLSTSTELKPPVAALYKDQAGIEYPSLGLLRDALGARTMRALDMCPANRNQHEGRLSDDDIKALWPLVRPDARDMQQVLALRAVQVRCSMQQLKDAEQLAVLAAQVLYQKLDKAAVLLKMGVAPSPDRQEGAVASPGCGCAQDGREGLTYAIYPLWADGTEKRVDFDVISRIGLYGMTIDDKGALALPPGVTGPPWTLLEAAHRHMTKVDWVLAKNDWNADGAGIGELLANLQRSIDGLLRTPFPKSDWRGTALATFGMEQGPSAGDGITLRFERFPTTPAAQQALNGFVGALYRQLHAMKPARQLNILVTQEDIVGGDLPEGQVRPFSAASLSGLMQLTNKADEDAGPADAHRRHPDDVHVLVLLHEPNSTQKLKLRQGIEDALYSADRVRLLRNVIPIVEYDGIRPKQLNDDIIYFQDNFGGIGFWPLQFWVPADDGDNSPSANHILHAYFKDNGDDGAIEHIRDLVCPNRTWLRWLAWISSIAAVAAGVTLARCRGCGTRLDSNRLYMAAMLVLIALPFVVITALVVGDPLFTSDSGVHWVLAAVLIGVVVVPGVYGVLKPAKKLP